MKKILFLVIASAMLLITVISFENDKTIALAAENNAYNVLFGSYEWQKIVYPSTITNGTQESDKIYSDDIDLAVLYMYSSNYSGNGTINSGCTLNWTQVSIYSDVLYVAQETSAFFHSSFKLMKDGEQYYSKYFSSSYSNSMLLFSGELDEGNYAFIYESCYALGVTSATVYTYTFSFMINRTMPSYTLKAGGNVIADTAYTNKTIEYSAQSPVLDGIYVKEPESSSFTFYYNSIVSVINTSTNGWYYFYAEDIAGNVTPTASVFLDTISPKGALYVNNTVVQQGMIVDSDFKYTATDDGSGIDYVEYKPPTSQTWLGYTSGAVISLTSAKGQYDFRAVDKCGNISEVSTIYLYIEEHSYHSEVIPPTCNENGYTKRSCSHCGDTYNTDIVPATGHSLVETIIPATCTESGGTKHSCSACDYEYISNATLPRGHVYATSIIKQATCTEDGERYFDCETCHDHYVETIPILGHNYIISDVIEENGEKKRIMTCNLCGDSYLENLGNQYEKVASYVELLFNRYSPYMIWVFVGTSGIWSIFMGVFYIIAQKNEEKEKARRMLVNYVIGMVAIFSILVACPFLIKGIAAFVT